MIQQTSLLAFESIKDSLEPKQRQVYNVIKQLKTACNLDIAEYLRLPINSITGRVYDLRELGLVELSHKDVCPKTGRLVIYWSIKPQQGRLFDV